MLYSKQWDLKASIGQNPDLGLFTCMFFILPPPRRRVHISSIRLSLSHRAHVLICEKPWDVIYFLVSEVFPSFEIHEAIRAFVSAVLKNRRKKISQKIVPAQGCQKRHLRRLFPLVKPVKRNNVFRTGPNIFQCRVSSFFITLFPTKGRNI